MATRSPSQPVVGRTIPFCPEFPEASASLGLNLRTPQMSTALTEPIRNIVPNLIYAANGSEVTTVMVAGRVLVRDGEVLTADEAAIRAEAQMQAEAVAQRAAADPVHKEMALLAAMEAGQL